MFHIFIFHNMPMSHYYKFGLYVRTMVQLSQLIVPVWQASESIFTAKDKGGEMIG